MLKFGYTSWVSNVDVLNQFLPRLEQDKLMGTACKKCGERYFPPRLECRCGSKEVEWVDLPRKGKLLSYTFVTFAPESMAKHVPYIVGVAELDGGPRILAHLIGVAPGSLKVGMPVQVVIDKIPQDRIIYKMKPA